MRLREDALPIRRAVAGACEILGIDPLYVACEGRLVAIVAADAAEAALAGLRALPLGADAADVGEICADPPGLVLLDTAFGGSRIVDVLVGDPAPADLLRTTAGSPAGEIGASPRRSGLAAAIIRWCERR